MRRYLGLVAALFAIGWLEWHYVWRWAFPLDTCWLPPEVEPDDLDWLAEFR